ncbi:hypothetical protein GmHk_11G031238 [Glycine max]|nr:hypothetical protein GmHk_11G031238 [Glycine max]
MYSRKEQSDKSDDDTFFKQLMGSIPFLCNSRPNISYDLGKPHKLTHDMVVAKKISKVLTKGTQDFGALFPKNWWGNKVDKSLEQAHLVIFFKFLNAPISCCSRKQIVLSITVYINQYQALLRTPNEIDDPWASV